ncbi:hypothetical protein QL093DRAFT_2539443 [Fusarium oxysporum]|nr:hypothetical protein QL093DRAFT_2539443 [Fusarium oxysporum]
MLIFLFTRVRLSIGHYVFYPSLNRQIIGSPSRQEEKLRVGMAFSFLAQIALTSSAWKSYT